MRLSDSICLHLNLELLGAPIRTSQGCRGRRGVTFPGTMHGFQARHQVGGFSESRPHCTHCWHTLLFDTPKAMASIFRTILYRYRSQIHDEIPIRINVPSQNLFTCEPCLGDISASCFSHVTSRGREPKCLWQVGTTSGGDFLGRLWALALELGVCWIHCTLNASWCYPLVI